MNNFKCKGCKEIFTNKRNLIRHMNYCSKNIDDEKIRYECEKCGKNYSRKDALIRHLRECDGDKVNKVNEVNANKTNGINGNKNKNNGIIGSKHSVAIGKKSKISVKKDCTTNNTVNNLVVLLNFPPDKYTMGEDLGKILTSDENFIVSMVKKMNVNENKPEQHNIYYPDIKSGHGEIYTNNKWNTKKIDEILNMLVETKTEDLNSILNEMNGILNEKTKNKIRETIKEFYDTKSRNNLKSHLKVILYDGKNIIKKTKKITEENKLQKEKSENNVIDFNEGEETDLCQLKKELALDLLDKINYDNQDYKLIVGILIKIADPNILSLIIRLLCKALYSNIKINNDTINNEINKEKEIEDFLSIN